MVIKGLLEIQLLGQYLRSADRPKDPHVLWWPTYCIFLSMKSSVKEKKPIFSLFSDMSETHIRTHELSYAPGSTYIDIVLITTWKEFRYWRGKKILEEAVWVYPVTKPDNSIKTKYPLWKSSGQGNLFAEAMGPLTDHGTFDRSFF